MDNNEDKNDEPPSKKKRLIQSGDIGQTTMTTTTMESKAAIMPNEEGKTAGLSACSAEDKPSTDVAPTMPTSKFPEIDLYLSRHVKAVSLPEIFCQDCSYAPLILDGASGVGKTQQAFDLLRSSKDCKLIYLNLSKIRFDSQPIYKEMDNLTKPNAIPAAILHAMEEVKSYKAPGEKDGTDRFSKYALENRLYICLASEKLKNLKILIEALKKIILKYQDQHRQDQHPSERLYKAYVDDPLTTETIKKIFGGAIFFIDEAVPETSEDRTELRFFCNLGRALGMRVVLAGTAATAANIRLSEDKDDNSASRMGTMGGNAMAQVVFLWQKMEETAMENILPQTLLQKISLNEYGGLKEAISKERPLLAVLMSEVLQTRSSKTDLMAVLKSVGGKLERKSISYDNHLMWLAGPYLDGNYRMPAALRMQAPKLVRDHFFEPAIAAADDSQGRPILDPGLCYWKRRTSPLRLGVHITSRNPGTLVAVMAQHGMGPLPQKLSCGSVTSDFDEVEMCFTNCIQQCLARKPLLAVALSMIEMKPEYFKKAISKNWKESLSQQTLGAADREVYEYIFFAAVQLASHSPNLELLDVLDFVKALEPYICKGDKKIILNPDDSKALRLDTSNQAWLVTERKNLAWKLQPEECELQLQECERTVKECELRNYKIPWLVPACNNSFLHEIPQNIFPDNMVAGLIPSTEVKARFDARSYALGSSEVVNWVFEFRSRSSDYTLNEAIKELKKKCKAEEAKSCHAMLIAYCETTESAASAWLDVVEVVSESNSKSELKLVRVAIVLGDA